VVVACNCLVVSSRTRRSAQCIQTPENGVLGCLDLRSPSLDVDGLPVEVVARHRCRVQRSSGRETSDSIFSVLQDLSTLQFYSSGIFLIDLQALP